MFKETDPKQYPNIKYIAVDASTFHKDKQFEKLSRRFDCAISPWFWGYAEDKAALDDFIKSVDFVLKPGAFLIGCTESIDDVKKLRVGTHLDDPSLMIEIDTKMKCQEGLWIHILGSAKFRFIEYLYTHETYQRAFEKNGFDGCSFLKPEQWIDGWKSTEKEKKMMAKLFNAKANFIQMFTTRKKDVGDLKIDDLKIESIEQEEFGLVK